MSGHRITETATMSISITGPAFRVLPSDLRDTFCGAPAADRFPVHSNRFLKRITAIPKRQLPRNASPVIWGQSTSIPTPFRNIPRIATR